MVKIKICALAKKKKKQMDDEVTEYKELKEYMYEDICPRCGASPTYQKDADRFVYCKSCGLMLDVEECEIMENKKKK